ncbi:MAG: sigma-54 dependent transcriptional regulator [Planctomycetota bacterium]
MPASEPTNEPRLAAQVLIVEDEPEHADVMSEALRRPGHVCTIVHGVAQALEELRGGSFDVVVTDLRMPASAGAEGVDSDGGDAGMVVLERARQLQPEAEVVMVTAHGDVATARAAFKVGAFDFVEKPLDLAVFREVVGRAAETVLLRHQTTGSAESGEGDLSGLVQHEGFKGIVAGSEAMRRIIHTVRTVANSTIPVLVTGESGTGKELIAEAVHTNSPRSKKRFVAFNCAGQTESLLEDALFGHVRGAFTGAEKDREGVFEYADGGTLFLDEIGDMPLTMQAKLLRVLESGEVVRVGANDPRKTDVRFVSATNRDLRAMVEAGAFREDLFFRINGSHVHLPPLRERRDDIPRIVRHAVAVRSGELLPGRPVPGVTDAAMMRLTAYAWPGNVRQLLNVVQNMLVMASAESEGAFEIDARHIPPEIRAEGDDDTGDLAGDLGGGSGSLAGASLEQLEKRAIRETLRLTGGNREQTAKLLGIGERTLYRKLKQYGLR